MAEWYYDYNHVDTFQVTNMLSDIGIQDVNTFVNDFRSPTGSTYYDEYGQPIDPAVLAALNLPNEFLDPYTRYVQVVQHVPSVQPVTPTPKPAPTPAPTPAPKPAPAPAPAPGPGPTPPPKPAPGPTPAPVPKPDEAKNTLDIIKKYDKNGDGKIAANDIEALLKDLGVGVVSPKLAQVLFELVDQNKNGVLDPPEVLALAAIMDKISAKAAPPTPK